MYAAASQRIAGHTFKIQNQIILHVTSIIKLSQDKQSKSVKSDYFKSNP